MERHTATYQKISPTAKMTAYWKAQSDIPWTREIADDVGAKQAALQLTESDAPSLASYSVLIMEARYKSINDAIEKTGLDNILELACGLSPRGLELAAKGCHYVGSDLPGISAEVFPVICEIAESENLPEEKLQLHPVNILDKDQLNDVACYFGEKSFVICNEGVLSYFNRQEKAKAAENIHDLLLQTGGVWITTDLAFHEIMFDMMDSEELKGDLKGEIMDLKLQLKRRFDRFTNKTGRSIMDNLFSGEPEAIEFYKNCGFTIRGFPMYQGNYEISTLSLIPKEARELMLEGMSKLKVWILKAKK